MTASTDRAPTAAPAPADRPPPGIAITLAIGVVIGFVTWRTGLLEPQVGIESSWHLALQDAADRGLLAGSELVFTYGPLGFLEVSGVTDGSTAVLSALYTVLIRALLGATLVWAASRSFPLPVAAVLALAVTALTPAAVAPLTITLVWCLVLLQDGGDRLRTAVLVGGGVLSGIVFLIKLNVGLTLPLLMLITALALDRGRARNVLTFLTAFVPTVVVLWFASGQTFGNVDDFASSSAEIISGYSEAMAIEAPYVNWDRTAAGAMIVALLGGAFLATRHLPAARRAGALLVVAVTTFAIAKQGYVRHDFIHVEMFLGVIAAPWLALRWSAWARVAPVAAVAIILALSPKVTSLGMDDRLVPRLAVEQLRALVDPSRRAELRDAGRERLAAEYGVPAGMLSLIGDRPVHASPWETNLVWAYDLNWRPLPVFQDYSAYTAGLDDLNAEALAAADGPDRILRHLGPDGAPPAIDNRYPPFEAPASTRAMLCNFRALQTTARYQLLARTPNRCGAPRQLGSVDAAYGEAVRVPAPPDARSAVFARIEGNEVAGLERLRALLYRAASRRIWLDEIEYRLLPQAGSQGLLLSAPPRSDFPPPFNLAANPATVMLTAGTGWATPDGPLRIEFYSLEIAPRPPGIGGRQASLRHG